MLQHAYFLVKIGADTAENEQHFAEILPIGRRVADRREAPSGTPLQLSELQVAEQNIPATSMHTFPISTSQN